MKKFNKKIVIILTIMFTLGMGGLVVALAPTPTTVNLGRASNFAILAGSGITNSTGPTTIIGDVGSSSTPTETGFETVTITGTNHNAADPNDATTVNAKIDLTTAFNDARDRVAPSITTILASSTNSFSDVGYTLLPGIYKSPSSIGITGTLTLDGGGNPNAVFIFQAPASTLTTAINSVIALTNGAQACNVFWQVGTSATLDQSTFSGTIMADQSITDTGGSTIVGRFLANIAHVTLSNTTITVPTCAPHLTLVKTIDNTGGGTELNTAWTLTATGTLGDSDLSGITGATGVDSDLKFPNATFKADVYTLSETGPTGYTASAWVCDDGALNGSTLTLENGDTAICSIVNTYEVPPPTTATLRVIKTVTNDDNGTKGASDFSFSVNGGTAVAFEADGQNDITVDAGTYNIVETAVDGYEVSYSNCSNLVLASGETATCTITNDDDHEEETPPDDTEDEDDSTSSERHSSTGGTVFGCKDPMATNYNYFSSSKPSLCTYASVAEVVTPKLPKTGFAPKEENPSWCQKIFSKIIRLFQRDDFNLKLIAESNASSEGKEQPRLLTSNLLLPIQIKIPSIEVDANIEYLGLTKDGAMDAPKGPSNVGWYSPGTLPGEKGSSVMDGHSGFKDNVPAVFDNLHKIKIGDKVYIENRKGSITTFVVKEIKNYDPEADASLIFSSSDGKAHLNIITCSGDWNVESQSHSTRLVVFTDKEN